MFLLRILLKGVKTLNSETSAHSIALAVAMGMFAGFVPLASLQTAVVLVIVCLFRIQLTTWFASLLVFKVVAGSLTGVFDLYGTPLLSSPDREAFWAAITHDPLLSMLRLNETLVLGGTMVGLMAWPAVYFLGRVGVLIYRKHLEGRFANSRIGRAFGKLRIVTLYNRITRPFA